MEESASRAGMGPRAQVYLAAYRDFVTARAAYQALRTWPGDQLHEAAVSAADVQRARHVFLNASTEFLSATRGLGEGDHAPG